MRWCVGEGGGGYEVVCTRGRGVMRWCVREGGGYEVMCRRGRGGL